AGEPVDQRRRDVEIVIISARPRPREERVVQGYAVVRERGDDGRMLHRVDDILRLIEAAVPVEVDVRPGGRDPRKGDCRPPSGRDSAYGVQGGTRAEARKTEMEDEHRAEAEPSDEKRVDGRKQDRSEQQAPAD